MGYQQQGVAMTCRSFAEYEKMFDGVALSKKGRILDVAGGASSFVAEARRRGYDMYGADPQYALSEEQIVKQGAEEIEESTRKLASITEQFDWSYYQSLERHKEGRKQSLRIFAENYQDCKDKNIYVFASLPKLPFENETFEQIFCSHFLFLYEQQFDLAFHRMALLELLRICQKGGSIYIYPLMTLNWHVYPGLDELLGSLAAKYRIRCTKKLSALPFIPKSTEYLHIYREK